MPLSEHVYRVALAFKVSKQKKQIRIKFCVKLEPSSAETTWMTQRPQSWETGDWQPHHKNVPTHASHLMQIFFGETSNQTTR